MIVDAVKQFAGSELYYTRYPDYDMPLVEAAAEVAEEVSLCTHSLVIKLKDADTSGSEQGKIVIDMKDGQIYTDAEFDWEWAALDTPEKVAYLLAAVFERVATGAEEFFWSSGTETNILLTEEEIAAINQELTAYFEANPIERPTEPPTEASAEVESSAEVSEETEPLVAPEAENAVSTVEIDNDLLKRIQETEDYQFLAEDPSTISVNKAYEYILEDFEGLKVHVLMLQLGGIDRDRHGISADVFLVDLATGEIYSNFNVPFDGWEPFTGMMDVYEVILSTCFWTGDDTQIWSEMERILPIQ